MKRQISFIALLLLGSALAGLVIGVVTSRAPQSVSIPVEARPLQPEPHPAEQSVLPKAAQASRTLEPSKPPAPPVHSDSTKMTASDSPPAATHVMPELNERELYQIAETNPAVAVELAAKLEPSPGSEDLMEDLIQRWANADGLAAAAWVELKATGDEQERLLQRIGFVLSQSNPADAAEFVVTRIPPGPTQDEAVMTVVNQWGNRNLAAAAAWVGLFPEGSLQERAITELEGIAHYRAELAALRN